MATLSSFDELNSISTAKDDRVAKMSQIRAYFDEMDLEPYEIEERIDLADDFETFFRNLFLIMLGGYAIEKSGGIPLADDRNYYCDYAYRGYTDVLMEHGYGTYADYDSDNYAEMSYMGQYAKGVMDGVVDTTILNIADAYYTSQDRSIFCAENESNAVSNYYKELEAIKEGYTKKTWVTKIDSKVRHTHKEVNGKKIDITKPFTVGSSQLMFPLDQSLGASLKEICRCRCVAKYSDKVDNTPEESQNANISKENLQNANKDDSIQSEQSISLIKQSDVSQNIFNISGSLLKRRFQTVDSQIQNEETSKQIDNANQLDKQKFKSEPNRSMFWSGKVRDEDGNDIVNVSEIKDSIAEELGLVTLEAFLKENDMDLIDMSRDNSESVKLWETASLYYAENAVGEVYVLLGNYVSKRSVWEK